MNRRPPADVRRQLRQEANFGCVVCGVPIIQYHHIVPYSEEQHHNPDKMVALCPNHHAQAGPDAEAITPDQLYEYKQTPQNGERVEYEFAFRSSKPQIDFASNKGLLRGRDEMAILRIFGEELIKISYENGILNFTADLYDSDGELVASLTNNEWWAKTNSVWDLRFRKNKFKIWHDKQNIGIEVEYDSDTDEIFMRGNFYYKDAFIRSSESKLVAYAGEAVQETDPAEALPTGNGEMALSEITIKDCQVAGSDSLVDIFRTEDSLALGFG